MARPRKIQGNVPMTRLAGSPPEPVIPPVTKQDMNQPRAVRTAEERPAAERSRPLFGVRTTTTDVEYQIPGHTLAWVTNYDDGRLQYAIECGYNYVTTDEISLAHSHVQLGSGSDVDSRVSRYAGTSESGKPVYRYLLKIETSRYEEAREINVEQSNRAVNQIYSGDHDDDKAGSRYTPTSVKTRIGSKIV